ncbi:GMC family oxidoreductase [Bradyrhizobium sp. Arg62]|uniref:FAD-dependent oxidoreductase n=1 Tax=Bradyrhizobium TaxID=374 RepID=UPI001E33A8D2|nr:MULTISPECIES: GMC family oxidoreductase [Bradyrhizobium]MCC8942026.1 GMC family oxidoreductase [Bradyrhizobium ivorense]MCC8951606.1 GMC family oxidoreductase [Bradyrhizobium brasilense]
MTADIVDVCVIGSGASGSTVAYEIAQHGLRVLLLEEGRALPPDASLASVQNDMDGALVRSAAGTLTPSGRPWTVCALGGGVTLYAGITYRYRTIDFDARAHVAGDALDPSWPINYAELRPYYDELEQRVGVARLAGADPLEPPSDPPVLPPHKYSVPGRLIADAGGRLGQLPFPTPLAINPVPYRGRPACHCDGPCNEHLCPSGARADARSPFTDVSLPPDALTVALGSKAVRIDLGKVSRADSVEWLDTLNRQRARVRARCVVLAGNAVQSAALLLRSAQRGAPDGIGNASGMVGSGISFKISGYVSGSTTIDPPHAHRSGGPFSTVALSDHYLDDEAPSGLGRMIYEATRVERTDKDGKITLRLHFLAADQPMRNNAVRLATSRDGLGLPKIVLDYWTHPLDKRRLGYLSRRASNLLAEAGVAQVDYQDSNYQFGSGHLHGGCRAGIDPAQSVADRWGRVHDIDNLYVADGGFFPYSGGVNPTFTIQANALRIARRIVTQLT